MKREQKLDLERAKVWRPSGFTGIEIEIFENAPNYFDPRGVLGAYHFNVNFSGSARVTYTGERHSFRYIRPLVMVQQPNEVYAADARGEPLTGWNLSVNEIGMRAVMDALELRRPLPHFPAITAPDVLNDVLAERLSSTIRAFDLLATRLERESRLLGILQTFIGCVADTSVTQRQVKREYQAVKQVREVLHARFADDIGLEQLAKLTGLSQGHLLRTFKLEVGVTPHVYQTGLRVDRAKELLAQGVNIAQAATETGFFDQSHLSHVFRKHVLVTPGQFQRDSLDRLLKNHLFLTPGQYREVLQSDHDQRE